LWTIISPRQAIEKLWNPIAPASAYSASVIISIIGTPTAPRGRVIRRRRIVRWGGWGVVAAVGAVRVVIRLIVGVREDGAEREGSEPDPNRGTRADPTCICGPRRRRQPDSGKDRCCDRHLATSFPKEPGKGHIPLLS
jgi:hypothetical protein